MIARKMLNGSGKLYLRPCNAPFQRLGNAFRILYLGDTPVSGASPDPEALAVPNGVGYQYNGNYMFRRVDRVWVIISDEKLASLVSEAVSSWMSGLELTFEELQAMVGADAPYLIVAYSAGLLGPQEFPKEPEKTNGEKIRIGEGWFQNNLFKFHAYKDGLALYEHVGKNSKNSLPIFHIMTAYRPYKPVVRAEFDERLESEWAVVEDPYMIDLVQEVSASGGESVGEILNCCGSDYVEEVAWGLAVLAALGCIDFKL